MPFFEHLGELRHRLIVIIIAVFVTTLALYPFASQILDILVRPILEYIPGETAYIFGPFEAFTFRFRIALYGALVLTSPILLWQLLSFFLPALRPKEQKWFIPTFIAALALFLLGNSFCYFYILGPAFQWMLGQVFGNVELLPSAPQFVNGITLMMLGFGAAFLIPVVIFYLIALGAVPYASFRKNWRIAYVVLLLTASIATPDWSPVTMGALFAVLVVLYEGSLMLARAVFSKRIKAQALAEAS